MSHKELNTIKDLFLSTFNSRRLHSESHTLSHIRHLTSHRSTYIRLSTHVIHIHVIIHVLLNGTHHTCIGFRLKDRSTSVYINTLELLKGSLQLINIHLVELRSKIFSSLLDLIKGDVLTRSSLVTILSSIL